MMYGLFHEETKKMLVVGSSRNEVMCKAQEKYPSVNLRGERNQIYPKGHLRIVKFKS